MGKSVEGCRNIRFVSGGEICITEGCCCHGAEKKQTIFREESSHLWMGNKLKICCSADRFEEATRVTTSRIWGQNLFWLKDKDLHMLFWTFIESKIQAKGKGTFWGCRFTKKPEESTMPQIPFSNIELMSGSQSKNPSLIWLVILFSFLKKGNPDNFTCYIFTLSKVVIQFHQFPLKLIV